MLCSQVLHLYCICVLILLAKAVLSCSGKRFLVQYFHYVLLRLQCVSDRSVKQFVTMLQKVLYQ